jgi:serine/threonine protein kinase
VYCYLLCYQIITLFTNQKTSDLYYSLYIVNPNKYWEKFERFSDFPELSNNLKDLIEKMFAVEPSQRISLKEIKAHPWFNESIPTVEDIKAEFEERKYQLSYEKERTGMENESTLASDCISKH